MRHLFRYRFIFHGSKFLLGLGLLLLDFSRSHLMRHSTIGTNPPDECCCPFRRTLPDDTHKRQISMPLAAFEPAISESELP